MTVPSDFAQPPRDSYIEDGATLVHAINFTFRNASEITVRRILVDGTIVPLTNPANYHVTGGAGGTGSITKTAGGIAGATIQIDRNTARNQLVQREPGDDFPVEEQEGALDKLTRIVQELARDILTEAQIRTLVDGLFVAGGGISLVISPSGRITIANTIDAEFIRDTIGATLVAGTGVQVTVDDALNRIVIAAEVDIPDCVMLSGDAQGGGGGGGGGGGAPPLTTENVMDIVGALLAAGTGISVNYNDAGDVLTITNTAPASTSYSDENARDAIGAALVAGRLTVITVDDPGNHITIDCLALDPIFRGLPVTNPAGAFDFADVQGGHSINYTGGAAAATLRLDAAVPLSDGWGVLVRSGGTGPLTINPVGGVTLLVNGSIVSSAASMAIGAIAQINRWGANYFTIVGPKVTAA